MKLSEILFRKMNILYIIVFVLMIFAIAATYNDYSYKMAVLEKESEGIYFVVDYNEEQSIIDGVTELTRVKTSGRVLKVDDELTGTQCKISDKAYLKEGETNISLDAAKKYSCDVIGKVDAEEIYPYEVLVSPETYESIKDNSFTYLVKIKNYEAFKKIFWSKDLKRLPSGTNPLFIAVYTTYYSTFITLGTLIAIFVLLVVIDYFNTLNYIKNNTKSTRKKTKDHKVLNASISTCISLLISGVAVLVIMGILV